MFLTHPHPHHPLSQRWFVAKRKTEVAGSSVLCKYLSIVKRGQAKKGWPVKARREENDFLKIRRSLQVERRGGFPPVMGIQ